MLQKSYHMAMIMKLPHGDDMDTKKWYLCALYNISTTIVTFSTIKSIVTNISFVFRYSLWFSCGHFWQKIQKTNFFWRKFHNFLPLWLTITFLGMLWSFLGPCSMGERLYRHWLMCTTIIFWCMYLFWCSKIHSLF